MYPEKKKEVKSKRSSRLKDVHLQETLLLFLPEADFYFVLAICSLVLVAAPCTAKPPTSQNPAGLPICTARLALVHLRSKKSVKIE